MFADDGAAAQARKADGALCAGAGLAVASALGIFSERDIAPLRHRFAEKKGRARWRIDLVAVMHFHDLDVPVGTERPGRLPCECGEEVDAEAHVPGLDDGRVPGRGFDARLVLLREARRADDVNDARLRRQRGEFDSCRRHGKVDQRVGILDERERIGRCLDAEGFGEPRQRAEIAPQMRRTFSLEAARQREAVRFGDEADECPAHAAARSRHGNLHVLAHLRPVALPLKLAHRV